MSPLRTAAADIEGMLVERLGGEWVWVDYLRTIRRTRADGVVDTAMIALVNGVPTCTLRLGGVVHWGGGATSGGAVASAISKAAP